MRTGAGRAGPTLRTGTVYAIGPPPSTRLLRPLSLLAWPVTGFFLALEVDVEPVHDMFEALDAMPRLTGARQLVRFARKAHHRRGYLSVLERAEHLFAARRFWRSPVGIAKDQHERGFDVVDIGDGRAF